MGSEADLDADIKGLSILSEHPELYPEFAKLGCAGSLVSLLAHENTDIAIDAIEVIGELIDEDVPTKDDQWNALVDGMLESSVLDLLHQNLNRFDEENEADRSGIYHILAVLESLSSRLSVAEIIGKHPDYIPWLIARARMKEKTVSQNKQYATEVLAIILQSSAINRLRFIDQDSIDPFLQSLSTYRKRDPEKGTEEEAYMENLFDCLTCAADEISGKDKFVEAEGIELCLIMLREGKMSKPRALRLLDHVLAGIDSGKYCERYVEAAGLKPLFSAFMKKQDGQATEHILGILTSMLRVLSADTAPRIRLLAKFVEKNYEKVSRLGAMRQEYVLRLRPVEREISEERDDIAKDELDAYADEWLSRRMDAGLFGLQSVDVILAWVVAEDDGARKSAETVLKEKGMSLSDVRKTLEDQLVDVDEAQKDMLNTLISCI